MQKEVTIIFFRSEYRCIEPLVDLVQTEDRKRKRASRVESKLLTGANIGHFHSCKSFKVAICIKLELESYQNQLLRSKMVLILKHKILGSSKYLH